jgi:hypothetical protein
MLHVLGAERSGDLPWQADVALVGLAGIDWPAFLDLAQRFAPLTIERLRELRTFGRLAIPQLPSTQMGLVRREFRRALQAYRAQSYYRKQAPSWPGFAEFVAVSVARKCAQAAIPSRFSRK